jgi:hypothetical protein
LCALQDFYTIPYGNNYPPSTYECKASDKLHEGPFRRFGCRRGITRPSERGKTHEQFFIRLRQEVGEDQEVLSGLLHDLHADPGAVRNTTAFLSEKLARIKLLLEDPSGGQLARLEKLEALALGIDGKRALWRSLLAVTEMPALRTVDFARLEQRAEDQRKRVEELRIEAAREALSPRE